MKSEAQEGGMSVPAYPTRVMSVLLGVLLIALTVFLTANAAQAKQNRAPLGAPIDVNGQTEDGRQFSGQLKNAKVTVEGNQAFVSGRLQGALDDGTRVNEQFDNVATTVSAAPGSDSLQVQQEACDILFLDLGPIFLDLLGLQIDLSEIILDINGQPGPGNLLGNLLCGLLGILD